MVYIFLIRVIIIHQILENNGKIFQNVQIDSINKNNISLKFLNRILFNQINILNDKTVLEIGCGAGRFTEYLVKSSKLCVSNDLSSAIFYNVSKK